MNNQTKRLAIPQIVFNMVLIVYYTSIEGWQVVAGAAAGASLAVWIALWISTTIDV